MCWGADGAAHLPAPQGLSCLCSRPALVPTSQVAWDGAALEKGVWWSCEKPPWPPLPFHLGAVFKVGPLPEGHHECACAWYDPCWCWPSDLTPQLHLWPSHLYRLVWKPGLLVDPVLLSLALLSMLFGHCDSVPLARSLPGLPPCYSSGCTCSCCSWPCKPAHLGACTQVGVSFW